MRCDAAGGQTSGSEGKCSDSGDGRPRIGYVPFLDKAGGGVYQYSLAALRALEEMAGPLSLDVIVLSGRGACLPREAALPHLMCAPLAAPSRVREALQRLTDLLAGGEIRAAIRWPLDLARAKWNSRHRKVSRDPDQVFARPLARSWLQRLKIDLMLYAAPTTLSFGAGIPYVMAIHDLQHRLQPEFPEVSSKGEWEAREYLFRNGARYAAALLADSETGKEDILNFYAPFGVTPDRVHVLPFVPPPYLRTIVSMDERQRVRDRYRLPERYLFYPAQFWPHKNHLRLVQALALLKETKGLHIPIVFCGSHSGEIREHAYKMVMDAAHDGGLAKQIQDLGYVPEEDMSALYACAQALVMPTFFGPTNIPVLEAWALQCPVLTSDIRGIREQVGDAAALVDPRSVEAIAEGILRLWTDDGLRADLARRGGLRLAAYGPRDFSRRLAAILNEALDRAREVRGAPLLPRGSICTVLSQGR